MRMSKCLAQYSVLRHGFLVGNATSHRPSNLLHFLREYLFANFVSVRYVVR